MATLTRVHNLNQIPTHSGTQLGCQSVVCSLTGGERMGGRASPGQGRLETEAQARGQCGIRLQWDGDPRLAHCGGPDGMTGPELMKHQRMWCLGECAPH